jgi:hypothetical protein
MDSIVGIATGLRESPYGHIWSYTSTPPICLQDTDKNTLAMILLTADSTDQAVRRYHFESRTNYREVPWNRPRLPYVISGFHRKCKLGLRSSGLLPSYRRFGAVQITRALPIQKKTLLNVGSTNTFCRQKLDYCALSLFGGIHGMIVNCYLASVSVSNTMRLSSVYQISPDIHCHLLEKSQSSAAGNNGAPTSVPLSLGHALY